MTTEQNLKTLLAAFGFCAVSFCVMRFASTHGHNYGPMVVTTFVPFLFSAGLTFQARFSLLRCAQAAAFVFAFLLFSVWSSGLAAVGVMPIVLLPLSVFLGAAAGERCHLIKNRG